MRVWIRALFGWLMTVLGLLLLLLCAALLLEGRVFEAGPMSIIGIVVFRGGIHLLKVAVAARICTHSRDRLRSRVDVPVTAARPASAPARPSW